MRHLTVPGNGGVEGEGRKGSDNAPRKVELKSWRLPRKVRLPHVSKGAELSFAKVAVPTYRRLPEWV